MQSDSAYFRVVLRVSERSIILFLQGDSECIRVMLPVSDRSCVPLVQADSEKNVSHSDFVVQCDSACH